MGNLITAVEFAAARKISKKYDVGKADEAIELSQISDLQQSLGGFFFDVLKNSEEASYEDLMNGSEFVYCSEEYVHEGLKKMLADLAYSRYIYMINVNLTPFGAQAKFTQDSSGIDRNTIKDLSTQAKVDAGIKFQTIKKYILSEPVLFSRFCKGENPQTGFFNQRFTKL